MEIPEYWKNNHLRYFIGNKNSYKNSDHVKKICFSIKKIISMDFRRVEDDMKANFSAYYSSIEFFQCENRENRMKSDLFQQKSFFQCESFCFRFEFFASITHLFVVEYHSKKFFSIFSGKKYALVTIWILKNNLLDKLSWYSLISLLSAILHHS